MKAELHMSDTSSHGASRADDPVAEDIDQRSADSGDIVAGEQVLDEGRVSPNQDDVGADSPGDVTGTDDPNATSDDLEHAADPRTDAGAAPIDPKSS